MYKLEIICGGCDTQFIVVTKEEVNPAFCPFCSNPLPEEDELDMGDESE